MAELVWDKVGDRTYESGLDKGVLYLPDGSAVPWNGLTSVIEKFDMDSSPVYYDGMKISELVTLGEFAAGMKAITYPDEFNELQGLGSMRRGMFVGDQRTKVFGLCYRTQIGNDLDGDVAGYKIHILYNVTAIPADKTYETLTESTKISEFEWNLTAVPEEVPGFRPTAHLIIDTREIDPMLLIEIEQILYGGTFADASLIPMGDLVEFISEWFRLRIIDNRDGTWTAITDIEGLITINSDGSFKIVHCNAVYLDDVTFIISDARDRSDVPEVNIFDFGDGMWSATADGPGIITLVSDGIVDIHDANVEYVSEDTYLISDTPNTE